MKRLTSLIIVLFLATSLIPTMKAEGDDAPASAVNAINYLSADGYAAFGLSAVNQASHQPADFADDAPDPLADYTPMALSELYVASMNRSSSFTGQAEVKKGPEELKASTINLDAMNTEYSHGYSRAEYQAQNATPVKFDKNDTVQGVAESVLYVSGGSSYQKITLYSNEMQELDSVTLALSDSKTDGKDWVKNVEADSALGLTAISYGGYYLDIPCIAVYVPSREAKGPYIAIYEITGKHLTEWQRIYLSDLNGKGVSAYNPFYTTTYHDWQVPIVDLATTTLSGTDDLVINACLPYKGSNGYSSRFHNSVSVIYNYSSFSGAGSYTMNKVFDIPVSRGSERMRFASAYETDLNGNGVNELVIAAHYNRDTNSDRDVGRMDDGHNLVQMVTWNEELKQYQYVWSSPQYISKIKEIYVEKEVVEPAAVSAGRYFKNDPKDYLFVEGVTYQFNDTFPETANTEADYFKSLTFSELSRMTLNGKRNLFVSQAATASFAKDQYGVEQTVVTSGYIHQTTNYKIYYDVSWIYGPNVAGSKTLTVTHSNNEYISGKGERDDGTFLTVMAIDTDNDSVYFKYKGKQSGWSAPTALAVLPATPHYGEMLYQDGYDSGEVSFSVTSSHESGVGGDWNVGGGINMGFDMLWGAGLFGNEFLMGFSFQDELLLSYLGSTFSSNNITTSITYSADGDTENVICMASPMTSYLYDVWVPEYEVTQEIKEGYEKTTGEPFPHAVGETVGGQFEEYSVSNVYDPQYSLITLEHYNTAVAQYNTGAASLHSIDMSDIYADYRAGSPDTYPQAEGDIPAVEQHSFHGGNKIQVGIDSNATFEVSYEQKSEYSNGFNLDFSAQVDAVARAKVSLGGAGAADGNIGASFAVGGGATWLSSTVDGKAITASLSKVTSGAYSYNAGLAMWRTTAVQSGEAKNPYVFGFLVDGADDSPPVVPEMWVYDAQTLSSDPNSCFVVLCWDDEQVSRKAGMYEVFEVGQNTTVSRGFSTTNMHVVSGLAPAESYTFQLLAYDDRNKANPSIYGKPVKASTQPLEHPTITTQPQNVNVTVGEDATFSVTAEPSSPGAGLSYQWQRYELSGDTLAGRWVSLSDVATSENTLTISNVQAGDRNTRYRVIVYENREVNGIFPMAYSQEALLNVDASADPLELAMYNIDKDGWQDAPGVEVFVPYSSVTTFTRVRFTFSHPDPNDQGRLYYFGVDASGEVIGTLYGSMPTQEGSAYTPGERDVVIQDIDKTRRGPLQVFCVYSPVTINDNASNIVSTLVKYIKTSDTSLLPAPDNPGDPGPAYTSMTIHSSDVDLDRNSFKLTYETGRGNNSSLNATRVTRATPSFSLVPAEVVGGTFKGWYIDGDESHEVDTMVPHFIDTAHLNLHAAYEFTEYGVTYHLDGGENHTLNPGSFTVLSPSLYLHEPTKTGYRFAGWYADPDFKERVYSIAHGSLGDKALYAKWELIEYSIYYTAGIGELPEGNPDSYTVHDTVSLKAPVFELGGGVWYTDVLYTSRFTGQPEGSTGTLVLYGSGNLPDKPIEPGDPDKPQVPGQGDMPGTQDEPRGEPASTGGVKTGDDGRFLWFLALCIVAGVCVLAAWRIKKIGERLP